MNTVFPKTTIFFSEKSAKLLPDCKLIQVNLQFHSNQGSLSTYLFRLVQLVKVRHAISVIIFASF